MIEDDDISKFVNNSEVESFEIKQEWLDDMSSQLDAYNSKMGSGKYWWISSLFIPIIMLPLLLLSDLNENHEKAEHFSRTAFNDHLKVQKSNESTKDSEKTQFNKRSIAEIESVSTSEKNTTTKEFGKTNTLPNNSNTSTNTVNIPSKSRVIPSGKLDNASALLPNKQNPDSKRKSNSALNLASSDTRSSQSQLANTYNSQQQLSLQNNAVSTSQADNLAIGPITTKTDNEKGESAIDTNQQQVQSFETSQEIENKASSSEAEFSVKIDTSESVEEIATTSDLIDTAKTEGLESKTDSNDSMKKAIVPVKAEDPDPSKLWSIGFTLGPDFLEKKLTASTSLENFEQKKNEELLDNTWGFDFEVNRYLTPWLTVGTGIGYKKFQEINSYSSSNTLILDTTYTFENNTYVLFTDSSDVISQDSSGNLDTTWVYTDSIFITETTIDTSINSTTEIDSSKKVANGIVTSSYIEIPINTQFIFISTDKLSAYANLGVTLGLLTKNTGQVINYNTNEIVNYTTRKMIYSSSIGLGINYNLIGPLDFKLYGAYRFNLTNLSLAPNVDKRYNGINLRTGIVYHF